MYLFSQGRCPSPAPALPDAYAGIADQPGARPAAQRPATTGATGGGGGVAAGSTGGSSAAARNAAPGASTSAGRSDGAVAPGVIYGSGPNKSGVWQRSNSLVSGVAQVPCCCGNIHCMDSMPARAAIMNI